MKTLEQHLCKQPTAKLISAIQSYDAMTDAAKTMWQASPLCMELIAAIRAELQYRGKTARKITRIA